VAVMEKKVVIAGVCGRYGAYVANFFFFQAEDGIRDRNVTGVQTCALPISGRRHHRGGRAPRRGARPPRWCRRPAAATAARRTPQIGRASCRERVEMSEGDEAV